MGADRYWCECADGLQTVPPAHWDSLGGAGSAPLRHGLLTAWERCELRGLRSRPVLAHAPFRTEPVGACPGYFYDLDIATVRLPQLEPLVRATRRLWPEFLYVHCYELGNPTPLTSPFIWAEPALDAVLVPSLIETAVKESSDGGAEFMLVQNFTSADCPAGACLADLGFAAVGVPPTAVVDLPYASFDEYLGAMRAQYRRRARQTLRRSAPLRVEHRSTFDDLAEDLARQWKTIFDRAREVKREVFTPAYFRAASAVDETSVLLLRRTDGTIASFALLLADGPWLAFLHCGFESRAAHDEGAYFRLLYEIIRFAIERGYEQVDLGITTLTPKLDVGAVPVSLIAWIRHRNPLIQRLILTLARGPFRAPKQEPRRVFKEAPPAAPLLVARRGLPT